MATDFKRGDTGINTAEGQISGPRAARLAKQRQDDQKDYESKKQKIQVNRMLQMVPAGTAVLPKIAPPPHPSDRRPLLGGVSTGNTFSVGC